MDFDCAQTDEISVAVRRILGIVALRWRQLSQSAARLVLGAAFQYHVTSSCPLPGDACETLRGRISVDNESMRTGIRKNGRKISGRLFRTYRQ